MSYELIEALKQIEREKGIAFETILENLEAALLSAYRKKYGSNRNVRIEIDRKIGTIKIFKLIEGEGEENKKEEIVATPSDFGRITAQTVKHVLNQRLREVGREIMYKEFKNMVGEVMTGIIRQTDQRFTLVDL
ncbi:unnamed protein product, partial [marine sediment metagenome]